MICPASNSGIFRYSRTTSTRASKGTSPTISHPAISRLFPAISRRMKSTPRGTELPAHLLGNPCSFLHIHPPNGDEGDDVNGAQAGMPSGVGPHVDQLQGLERCLEGGFFKRH